MNILPDKADRLNVNIEQFTLLDKHCQSTAYDKHYHRYYNHNRSGLDIIVHEYMPIVFLIQIWQSTFRKCIDLFMIAHVFFNIKLQLTGMPIKHRYLGFYMSCDRMVITCTPYLHITTNEWVHEYIYVKVTVFYIIIQKADNLYSNDNFVFDCSLLFSICQHRSPVCFNSKFGCSLSWIWYVVLCCTTKLGQWQLTLNRSLFRADIQYNFVHCPKLQNGYIRHG